MQEEPSSERGFLETAKRAADLLTKGGRNEAPVRLISHVDTDGQTSGAVIAKALQRADISFQARVVPQLEESNLAEAKIGDPKLIVLTDLGSGSLELVSKVMKGSTALIIDHHQVREDKHSEELLQVNPRLFGIDGEKELSASGTAYFVAKAIDEINKDLSVLAVLGALGDLQDRNSERSLKGMNKEVVRDAVDDGLLKTDVDLLLFGRETRPLHNALASTTNPFLPGLSSEEDQCLALITKLDIPLKEGNQWRVLGDLTEDEKKTLFNGITAFLTSHSSSEATMVGLIGVLYTLLKEEKHTPFRDGREFSSLLNACGRARKPGLGIAIATGDRNPQTLKEAQDVLTEYRKTIAEGVRLLTSSGDRVKELNAIYWVNTEGAVSDQMVSSLLSLLANIPMFHPLKPIVATAKMDDGRLKVSARGHESLLDQGLNLGAALTQASILVGGSGGGHKVAAGAVIPVLKREGFLKSIDELVASQIRAGSHGPSGDHNPIRVSALR